MSRELKGLNEINEKVGENFRKTLLISKFWKAIAI